MLQAHAGAAPLLAPGTQVLHAPVALHVAHSDLQKEVHVVALGEHVAHYVLSHCKQFLDPVNSW